MPYCALRSTAVARGKRRARRTGPIYSAEEVHVLSGGLAAIANPVLLHVSDVSGRAFGAAEATAVAVREFQYSYYHVPSER